MRELYSHVSIIHTHTMYFPLRYHASHDHYLQALKECDDEIRELYEVHVPVYICTYIHLYMYLYTCTLYVPEKNSRY